MKPVMLMILDGWGIAPAGPYNAAKTAKTPELSRLFETYPHTRLLASGNAVGLPEGQMGNSEVGHLNIGAGRIVYQELTRITKACEEGTLLQNKALLECMAQVKQNGGALHLMGLLSDGGVHSHESHLWALLKMAKANGLEKVYVHAFLDGRDVGPSTALTYVERLQKVIDETDCGEIATVSGRYYAMDRDKRWNRVKEAYDMLVEGKGAQFGSAVEAMQASYDADVTDEFVKPAVICENGVPVAKVEANDAVIFFNFRNDRARELTSVLTQKDMPEEGMHTLPLYYCCLTPYDASFTGVHILFDKEEVTDTLGETIAKAGKRQLRIAETEKYAHVTFFFNGGRETPFENEDRILVNSPKVATYDLQPEMSAIEVADKLCAALREEKEDMVILNFANGDMVGHTGVYGAICNAVGCIDGCVEAVVTTALAHGYVVLLTADHGNADHAVNDDGTPNTAHSLNPVQFIVIGAGDEVKTVRDGALCNVAPTILKLMGIPQPAAMTAEPLI